MLVQFTANNQPIKIDVDPDAILADVLRDRLGLKGTKISCREGECGACTVWLDGQPVNSCLIPVAKVEGRTIVTIEGLGNIESPHPVQERIAEYGGSQCGFCSPGFVMSAAALLRDHPSAGRAEIVEGLSGNLCRCTGYVKIIAAVESLVDRDSGE
ncbi:MAG: (2Fe-2S)-binding protein [Chloroflexi bacterium]|nr:(2Fe-2S)-binding protein [Chloroflexota bacterium]